MGKNPLTEEERGAKGEVSVVWGEKEKEEERGADKWWWHHLVKPSDRENTSCGDTIKIKKSTILYMYFSKSTDSIESKHIY